MVPYALGATADQGRPPNAMQWMGRYKSGACTPVPLEVYDGALTVQGFGGLTQWKAVGSREVGEADGGGCE